MKQKWLEGAVTFATASLLFSVAPAFAGTGILAPCTKNDPKQNGACTAWSESGAVEVWHQNTVDEGLEMKKSGADAKLMVRYLACTAPSGTRAMVRLLLYSRAHAVVLDGPLAGCRGIVGIVNVKNYKE